MGKAVDLQDATFQNVPSDLLFIGNDGLGLVRVGDGMLTGGATMKGVTLANFRRYVKAGATEADLRKIATDSRSAPDWSCGCAASLIAS
ncbi:hypothetical protein FJ434_27370 [Mesorhizobium sp. B2-5-13]|uniref:hypothetical protein n=2 Tax=Mesorhizobium TaxID=68287 RepID=UPI00112A2FE4|nr:MULTISPECIES: hypothetical protein [unclassified Mesorhizobium]TPJ75510.1 hypothetical protein FJ434_27370 [Mesorhizobium sp. B2-5-13]TPK41452.1 hypothetical protein FJ560_27865 [Mesorhizobium sp. B2-5-5]